MDAGGVGGDADFLVAEGALDVHCKSAVDVCVKVVHHAGGEGHVHKATLAVVAGLEDKNIAEDLLYSLSIHLCSEQSVLSNANADETVSRNPGKQLQKKNHNKLFTVYYHENLS